MSVYDCARKVVTAFLCLLAVLLALHSSLSVCLANRSALVIFGDFCSCCFTTSQDDFFFLGSYKTAAAMQKKKGVKHKYRRIGHFCFLVFLFISFLFLLGLLFLCAFFYLL